MDLKAASPARPVGAPESYTILRVKRKRNEEPLDALVFDAQTRKRTKSAGKGGPTTDAGDGELGVSVFQFAETVEEGAWVDQKARESLQARITALAKDSTAHDQDRALGGSAAQAEHVPPNESSSSTPDRGGVTAPASHEKRPVPHGQRSGRDDPRSAKQRKYTIVMRDEDENRVSSVKFPVEPPKVISAKSLEAQKSQFNLYDAVLSSETRVSSEAPEPVPVPDPEMEKFLPMLQDYLRINDISLAAPSPPSAPARRGGISAAGADETRIGTDADEDDYVWDVFYYRPSLNIWDTAALSNFGSLTGLPPSVNDPDESDSESEPEDEGDEDSNAEDYYKNDYPDEDEDWGDSDEFHEDSDYDDLLRDDDNDENHAWR